jgi:Domain of unknown function (DUF397)
MDSLLPPLGAGWRTSSYSQPSDSYCVEAGAFAPETVSVRDSKDRQGPTLTFSTDAWTAFLDLVTSDHAA